MAEGDPPAHSQQVEELIKTLTGVVNAGFERIDQAVGALGDRTALTEMKLSDMETWRARNSDRVGKLAADTSNADLSHDAKLAEEIAARQKLAEKLGTIENQNAAQMVILNRLDKITESPQVKRLAWLAVAVATGWLTLHLVPPQPPPPQLAPTTQVTK